MVETFKDKFCSNEVYVSYCNLRIFSSIADGKTISLWSRFGSYTKLHLLHIIMLSRMRKLVIKNSLRFADFFRTPFPKLFDF